MADKQLPDWAIAKAFRQCQVFAAPSKTREFILLVEHRARELSAQQPDAARGEHCPKCNFTMSGVGHCVNCAEQPAWYGACHGVAAPYDHTKPPPGVAPDHHGKAGQRLQPARDGVDSLSGYVEYLREDKATKYSDPCNAAVQTERLRIADELEAIGASSPPQPADGEAVYQLRPNVLNGAKWVDVSEQDYQQALTRTDLIEARTLYLRPSRGVEVTEEDCHKAMDAAEYFNSNTNISLGAMRAALTSFTYTIMERDKREATLSGVQR